MILILLLLYYKKTTEKKTWKTYQTFLYIDHIFIVNKRKQKKVNNEIVVASTGQRQPDIDCVCLLLSLDCDNVMLPFIIWVLFWFYFLCRQKKILCWDECQSLLECLEISTDKFRHVRLFGPLWTKNSWVEELNLKVGQINWSTCSLK